MILQNLLFPNKETCTRNVMYYKGERVTVFMENAYCAIPQGALLSTHTYFNSFSVGKWKKYTVIDNLSLRLTLEGDFHVRIRHARKMLNQIKDIILTDAEIRAEKKQDISIPIPYSEDAGLYYFELIALSDNAKLFGGAYETEIDINQLPNVKIAIGICTFRRELYIAKNMEILQRTILENPESPLFGNLEIFISDNSKTLDTRLATDKIHIFPNRNLGGAGGFTRSMIEIKNVQKEKGFSHILMMDDDVRINPDSLVRTYTLLRLLKPEHKHAFLGGHMLKIDAPNIQSEAADHWDIVAHHPVKYNYNLDKIEWLIKNEIEDSVNYFGWWYCCMPASVINDNNLPLPLFIKRDDIEYGLRNGKEFITLNGICVWHEPFEYKYSTYLEYYYFRNMCIINSRHRLSFNEERLINEVRKRTKSFLLRYRYKDAELSLLGIQHYLNGIDWLKQQDGEKLNAEIMKIGYKKEPLEKLDFVFTHGIYERNLKVCKSRRHKKILKYTLNGWLLPANKNIIVPVYNPDTALFYRAKKVLNYEEITHTGFFTQRDYHSLFYILKMYHQTIKMIRKKYKKVTAEYRDRYDELTNINFWREYLFKEGDVSEITSGLDNHRRPQNTKMQYRELAIRYGMYLLQILLCWLPVKKNRVMVYVHDRKGITCNPKYIVKKLIELYGDKLEIIWATMHPETCQEIQELGVQVIRSNTLRQVWKYTRSRFFITNDSFPSWAMHRKNQKWLNTWHAGMNYKHIGYDYLAPMSKLGAKLFKIKNRQPDFYLSGSQFFTEDTSKSFRFDERIFLPFGLPRNDIFFENQEEINEKVRNTYNISKDKHLVIFAPTFRRGMKSDTYDMDFEKITRTLEDRFGGEWILLFRNHNFVKSKQTYEGAIDVSNYHDMQELMCASDVLISDYSSCLYDFCMTKKPVFVYATDLDNYINNDRAFAYPLKKWPFSIAKSNKELIENIRNYEEQDYRTHIEAHLKDAGAYDRGNASKQVAALIQKYCL